MSGKRRGTKRSRKNNVDDLDEVIKKPRYKNSLKLDYSKSECFEEIYNMSHSKRGKAIIFNHYNCFGHTQPRKGTESDVTRLEESLTNCLNFEVCVYTDLTKDEIKETLESLSQDSYDDEDCLAIFVLTHGNLNKLTAKDEAYPIDDLWHYFTPDKCPSLAGKPKLFFINACRGKKFDEGKLYTKMEMPTEQSALEEDESRGKILRIPIFADFLTFYSTMEGFISIRHAIDGTWFIQSFCETIESEQYRRLELKEMLTIVARKTALKCNDYKEIICQIPTLMSTLIKSMYFE